MAEAVSVGEYDILQDTAKIVNPTGVEFEDTPISRRIKELIDASPAQRISFAEYMNEAMYGDGGYYSENVALGNSKENPDFTTSPETSPDFAFPFAQTAFKTWIEMGKPDTFDIVEMGAGRGVLAKAMLDWVDWAATRDPGLGAQFANAVQYRIVERSDGLISQQKQTLAGRENVSWVPGSAIDLPVEKVNGMILSNELPDAFPVARVKVVSGRQVQCYVTVKDGQWVEEWDTPDEKVAAYLDRYGITIPDGEEVSVNLGAEKFQNAVDHALERGVVVTVDYSTRYEPRKQISTIRTRNQKDSSDWYATDKIYRDIGNRDMTANVDYEVLERIARRDQLDVFRMTQGDFVNRSGIGALLMEEKQRCIETMDWETLVAYSRRMAAYDELKDFHDFEVMIAAKGVDLPACIDVSHDFTWDEVVVPAIRYYDPNFEEDWSYPLQDANGKRVRKALTQPYSRVVPIYIHEIEDGVMINDFGSLHDLSGDDFKRRCKAMLDTRESWEECLSDPFRMELISLDESEG